MWTRLNHVRRGRGVPRLLIHGMGRNLGSWAPMLDRLAEERDGLALDLHGHGRSSVLPRCGHGPMPDDLEGVSRVTLEGCR